jgi:hypothetical protein
MFKVGDKVEVVVEHDLLNPDVIHEVSYYGPGISEHTKDETYVGVTGNKGRWLPSRFRLVSRPTETNKAGHAISTSRSNDPATSKGKRRVNKYEQAVLDTLGRHKDWYKVGPPAMWVEGMTGKELAMFTDLPLNSLTPRFAPLRRKGLIKDSGWRRDKQIVWVLA